VDFNENVGKSQNKTEGSSLVNRPSNETQKTNMAI